MTLPFPLSAIRYIYFPDSLSCPDYFQCTNNSVCVVDPLIPKTPTCKCLLGFKMSPDGKCEGMSSCHWSVPSFDLLTD